MSNKTQLQTNNTALDALITRVNAAKDTTASLPEAGGGSGGIQYEIITIPAGAKSALYTLPRVTSAYGVSSVPTGEYVASFYNIIMSIYDNKIYSVSDYDELNSIFVTEHSCVTYTQGVLTIDTGIVFEIRADMHVLLINDPSKQPIST